MADDRLTLLLERLNTMKATFSEDVLAAWRDIRDEYKSREPALSATADLSDLLFACFAVVSVAPDLLAFICQQLYSQAYQDLSTGNRSRLNNIAHSINSPALVCFLVLGQSQSNNHSNVKAFGELKRTHPDVTFRDFYEKADPCYRERVGAGVPVSRPTVIRASFAKFGENVWPPRAASLASASAPAPSPSPSPAPAQDEAEAPALIDPDIDPELFLPAPSPSPAPLPELPASPHIEEEHNEEQLDLPASAASSSPRSPPEHGLVVHEVEVEVARSSNAQRSDNASSVVLRPSAEPLVLDVSSGALLPPHSSSPSPVPEFRIPKRPGSLSISGQAQKRRAIHDKSLKRGAASLDEIFEAVTRTLAPGQYLNDYIIDTAVMRLEAENIGYLDTIAAKDPDPDVFRGKPVVLIPHCEAASQHWRLFVFRHPDTLEVYDSLFSQDSVAAPLQAVISQALDREIHVSRVHCTLQTNGFDCGLFVIESAENVAGQQFDTSPSSLLDSEAWRTRVANQTLTSPHAMLPVWKPVAPLASVMANLWKRMSHLRALEQLPSLLAPTQSVNLVQFEVLRTTLEGYQSAALLLHADHQRRLGKAIALTSTLQDRIDVVHQDPRLNGIETLRQFRAERDAANANLQGQPLAPMSAIETAVIEGLPKLEDWIEGKVRPMVDEQKDAYAQCTVMIIAIYKCKEKYEAAEQELAQLTG
ncbi:hypothetical protein ACHAP5_010473 [Fusarium lateritium]